MPPKIRFASLFLAAALMAPAVHAADRIAVLLPGAGGPIPSDFLMRNRSAFERAGFSTVVATDLTTVGSAVADGRRRGARVAVVAMSRGTLLLADALRSGVTPDAAVFVSGSRGVAGRLGSAQVLPRTLVVHNPEDACPGTDPASAQALADWAGSRVRLQWIRESGPPVGTPCGPFGAHGYHQRDGAAVSAIVRFISAM